MKILFIATFPPPVHGSALVSEYVFNLIGERFDLHRIDTGSEDVLSNYNSKTFQKIVFGILKLIQLVIKMPGDCDKVYFTPAINGLPFWRDIILLCLIKVKSPMANVLLHIHNKGLEKSTIKRKIFNFLTKNVTVIVLTKKLSYPYKNCVRVVNNFPINSPATPVKRKKEVRNVGYLSNYILEKGIKTFIEIACDLQHTSVKFQAAGNDADCTRVELISIIEFNKQKNIQIHSSKNNQEKWKFLDRLDVLLFPSTYKNECSPLVLLEAMSRGVLVICYKEGGIEDMLPRNSICLVSNKSQMTKLLEKMINNPGLFVMELKAQQLFFKSNFTEEKFRKKMIDLFYE